MKRLLSLALVGMFCFVGLSMTGCSGGGDNTVVEPSPEASMTEQEEATYEEEMAKAMKGD